MLILTRRVGETIIIGDDIRVSVIGVKGNQVRLAFDAPKEVTIHREEIKMRIDQERIDMLIPAEVNEKEDTRGNK